MTIGNYLKKAVKFVIGGVVLGGAFVASAAHATPVLWEVNATRGPNSSSPADVVGSFVYDADTNMFSDIDLEASSAFLEISSVPITALSTSFSSSPTSWLFTDGSNENQAGSVFVTFTLSDGIALTNAGGLINAGGIEISQCVSDDGVVCTGVGRSAIALQFPGHIVSFNGTPIVSEVPLPAAAWMFLAGLGGLSAARRKGRDNS